MKQPFLRTRSVVWVTGLWICLGLGTIRNAGAEWADPFTIAAEAFQKPSMLSMVDIDEDGDDDILLVARRWDQAGIYAFYLEHRIGESYAGPHFIAAFATTVPQVKIAESNGQFGIFAPDSREWAATGSEPGTFVAPLPILLDAAPLAVSTVEDFDRDGQLDTMGFDDQTDTFAVFLGESGGGAELHQQFDSPFPDSLPEFLHGLTDADADGDSDQLLAVDEELWLLRNNGDHTFELVNLELPASGTPHWLDLDRDNLVDLIVTVDERLQWYRHNGNLEFAELAPLLPLGGEASILALAHANPDDRLDIAVRVDNQVGWAIQLDADFEARALGPIPTGPLDEAFLVSTGLFNDDAAADIVFVEPSANGPFAILLNDGTGISDPVQQTFIPYAPGVNEVVSVTAGDFDNNDVLDVAVAQKLGGELVWYRNQGGGQFETERHVGFSLSTSRANTIHSTDFNDDGLWEIVHLPALTNELVVHVNPGQAGGGPSAFPIFPVAQLGTSENEFTGLMLDDFSGDTRPDLVCSTRQGIYQFRDMRAGQIGFQQGRLDTFQTDPMAGAASLVRFQPTQAVPHILVPTMQELFLYQWNGQGYTRWDITHQMPEIRPSRVLPLEEMLAVDLVSDGIFLNRLAADTTLTDPRTLIPEGRNPLAADVDQDEHVDLIALGDGGPLWYPGLEDHAFGEGIPVNSEPIEGNAIALADLNGDEWLDLIVGDDRQLIWFPNYPPDRDVDTDGDGLPDAWEDEEFETLEQSPGDVIPGTARTVFSWYAFGESLPELRLAFRGKSIPALVFTKRRDDSHLRYSVVSSRDLIDWTPVWTEAFDLFNPLVTEVLQRTAETDQLAVRLDVPGETACYYRMAVELRTE